MKASLCQIFLNGIGKTVQSAELAPETHVLDMFDMFSALWVDERLVADTFAFLPKERWLVVLVRPEMQHCVY